MATDPSIHKGKNVKDSLGIDAIQELVAIKPQISDFSSANLADLETGLNRLNSLLEQFALSQNTRVTSGEVADALGQEGGHLWNASILLRGFQYQGQAERRRRVLASLRLAAFRLTEAGINVSFTVESLTHLLRLGNETAAALSECDDDRAQSTRRSAASYESQLKHLKGANRDASSKKSALAQYFCTQMCSSWKEGNKHVAFIMLEEATDEHRLEAMPIDLIEEILSRALEIGSGLVHQAWCKELGANTAMQGPIRVTSSAAGELLFTSVKWLQKVLQVLEQIEHTNKLRLRPLKEILQHNLARAYFASSGIVESNSERAKATIDNIIQEKDVKSLDVNLLWMKLAILRKGEADTLEMLDVFRLGLGGLKFQETEVAGFLREVQAVANTSVDAAIDITQDLLKKALESPNGIGYSSVGVITLSLLLFIKPLQHSNAQIVANTACQSIARKTDLTMDRFSAAACQLELQRTGEASYKAKKWAEAADWFALSASPAFRNDVGVQSRYTRRAVLCYVKQGEYTQASLLISRCSQDKSATQYVRFITAVNQGLKEEAIRAVESMPSASDFDPMLLLLATQLAHEAKQKILLLAALEAMYRMWQREPHAEIEAEDITLIRCSIRVLLDLLGGPSDATHQLVELLKHNLQRALGLINAVASRNSLALIAKNLSCLWRTAYTAAISWSVDWEALAVAEIFDLARGLMEAYSTTLAGTQDSDLKQCIMQSSFWAISVRLSVARNLGPEITPVALYTRLATDTPTFRQVAVRNLANGTFDSDQPGYMINLCFTLEIEVLCRIHEWQRIEGVVEAATKVGVQKTHVRPMVGTILGLQAAAKGLQIMFEVLYNALETSVQAIVDHEGRFIAFETGFPGSKNDTYIWKHSFVWQHRHGHFDAGEFVLADGGYPPTPFVLTPFAANERHEDGARKRQFNQIHSRTRGRIERTFGQLKGRFPALQMMSEVNNLDDFYRTIEAMMVLHNMCYDLHDTVSGAPDAFTLENDDPYDVVAQEPADTDWGPGADINEPLLVEGRAFRLQCMDIICPE